MTLAVQELDPKRHDRAGFDCGVEVLNRYLSRLAAQHRAKGIATTFVLIDLKQPAQIQGYYALSAATIELERLTDADRKGLPDYPIPAVRIGRLAGSLVARGQGVGALLLQNAIKRILLARGTLGVYAVVVEAKDDPVEAFYRKYGFRRSDSQSRQLYLPLGAG
ncbi:MAG: GNAT family N-acetyltransferase [Pseudomonadales bacterium]|nr:GNAT family N-acetyltransferase [Pseudomonadales bacterium]